MRVIKAEACGNDFLLIAASEADGRDAAQLARAICDRHAGIGADGLILYTCTTAGAVMRLINADGSGAEVSGNGVRCLAALLLDTGAVGPAGDLGGTGRIVVETDAGPKRLELLQAGRGEYVLRAAMGHPTDLHEINLEAGGERVRVASLRVGNPQCVVLEPPVTEDRLYRLGPILERHPAFPQGTNVALAEVVSSTRVRILIWERGVGRTSASGTGACAAAVAAASYLGASRDIEIESPGGAQRVEWLPDGLYLTGRARIAFRGEWWD
jgi:diaminopimelate epimerase